jgi:hypothetical protein
MPLQNRVTPSGEIVRDPARGLFTGNRGILHDDGRRLARARWRHPHWIVCRLSFKDHHREVMTPGRWTELFFLDEAVALAAGHRPCAYCRREAFLAFKEAWLAAHGGTSVRAGELDRTLHRQRVEPRTRRQVTHEAELSELPDGSFVRIDGVARLVVGRALRAWSFSGYEEPTRRRSTRVEVLTPAATVAVLRHGYRPLLHPTAS